MARFSLIAALLGVAQASLLIPGHTSCALGLSTTSFVAAQAPRLLQSCTPGCALKLRRTTDIAMKDIMVKFPGGRSATVPEGSPLSLAAYKAGAQITYQCKAGTCSSCEVMLGMFPVKTCQTAVKAPFLGNSITVSAKPGSATRLK